VALSRDLEEITLASAAPADIRSIVLGEVDAPAGPIVVGVDMTRSSRRAAVDAARLAASTGVGLHLVLNVRKPWSVVVVGHGEAWNLDGYSVAEQFLDNLIIGLPVTGVTRTITVGTMGEAVKREAARLDAGVTVVRRRRPFHRAWVHLVRPRTRR
jgi:hypothetical protein